MISSSRLALATVLATAALAATGSPAAACSCADVRLAEHAEIADDVRAALAGREIERRVVDELTVIAPAPVRRTTAGTEAPVVSDETPSDEGSEWPERLALAAILLGVVGTAAGWIVLRRDGT